MKTKLVTSYYPFHAGAPFWGQVNRDRWYKYSLAAISNMGEIVCYTDPGDKGYNQLMELKETFNLQNLSIKIYELLNNPFQERVYAIRTGKKEKYNNPEAVGFNTRPTVVYWMKFLFLGMEYEPNTMMYWIDSGLSHTGLFPSYSSRYGSEPEFPHYPQNFRDNEYKVYHYDQAFTPLVLEGINQYAGNGIINLCRTTSDDSPASFNAMLNIDMDYQSIHPVAGFFGGSSEKLLPYLSACENVIEQVLAANEVCTEQSIMAYVNATHRTWFKNWMFDTFYHEDWTNVFHPGQISFSHFFLKPLV